VRALARSGNAIEAIKVYREETGCDLRTAKEAVESLRAI
jgi:ribosomal protein L7/L12